MTEKEMKKIDKEYSSLNVEQRLASTEADVRHLADSFDVFGRSVNKRFDDIDHYVSKRFDSLDTKLDEHASRGLITWPLIFTAVGTLVACAGLAGIIHAMSLAPLISRISENKTTINRFMDSPGHPNMVMQTAVLRNDVDRLDRNLENLDGVLQREMRLLDANGQDRLDHLDQTLQREMRLLLESQKVGIAELSRRLTKNEEWMVDHDQRVISTNSRQTAQIEALMDKIKVIEEEQRRRTDRVYKKEG